MNCSLPGSSIHRILQARILERVAMPSSRGSSWQRIETEYPTLQADSLSSEPLRKPRDAFVIVQSLSLCPTLCDPMDCNMTGSSVLHYLLEFAQTHVHWFGDAIQPSHPLPPPSPPALNLSEHWGLFQWVGSFPMGQLFTSGGQRELQLQHQVANGSFSFSISPSNEYSGLISFRIDWFDFHAIQGTLKSLLQLHSLKASIHQLSTFFMVQLSHPYMTTGNTIALTIWTFVGKIISLVSNTLSRLLIAFLPRSKHLLISWLQSLSTVIWSQRK